MLWKKIRKKREIASKSWGVGSCEILNKVARECLPAKVQIIII